jgi:hypothetical protein
VTGVPGDFGDHAQVDESQGHGADKVVFDSVVHMVVGCQFVRPLTRRGVFGDHVGRGFVVGDVEAAATACGVAVAFLDAHARQGSLKPNAFGRSAVLDQ